MLLDQDKKEAENYNSKKKGGSSYFSDNVNQNRTYCDPDGAVLGHGVEGLHGRHQHGAGLGKVQKPAPLPVGGHPGLEDQGVHHGGRSVLRSSQGRKRLMFPGAAPAFFVAALPRWCSPAGLGRVRRLPQRAGVACVKRVRLDLITSCKFLCSFASVIFQLSLLALYCALRWAAAGALSFPSPSPNPRFRRGKCKEEEKWSGGKYVAGNKAKEIMQRDEKEENISIFFFFGETENRNFPVQYIILALNIL